jgi:hypothetical protein
LTRDALLGFFDPHPDILRQIEGAGERSLTPTGKAIPELGRRVDDQDW